MQLQTQKSLVRFVIVGLLALAPGLAQTIATTAGNGSPGFAGDNGSATSAQIDTAYGVAVDGFGNTYVADSRNHRVRKIASGVITTVAGTGQEGFSGDGAAATAAQLSSPRAVAVDTQGNLYIADTGNCRIRKVTLSGVISTVAGTGTPGFSGDGGSAAGAQLSYPEGLATDSASNVYIADSWNYRVRKMTTDGKIQTIAGNGSYGPFGDGGQATAASLGLINSLTLDAFNNLYLSDSYNHLVRTVTPGGVISTVVGGGFGPAVDGGAARTASLKFPKGIATDLQGNLYVADSLNHRIRKVIPGGAISTVAGSGTPGYSGDGGTPASARLNSPHGIAANPGGDLTFSDLWNYRVRVLDFGASTCASSISTTDLGVAASGGFSTLTIRTDAGCSWSITSLPAWLVVWGGASQGSGSATVTLFSYANSGGARSAALSVGGVSVPIRQLDGAACGGSSTCVVRALPHLAFGGPWTSGLSAIGSGTVAGSFSASFYGDAGASLALPFTGGLGSLSTLTDTVPPGGMKYYEAENASAPEQSGWALVTADDSVAAQTAFRRRTNDNRFYEAAVPSSGGYSRFVMPFDATTFTPTGAQLYTAFAIVNLNPSAAAQVVCTARNQSGVFIPNAISIPALSPLGHFVASNFPALTGQRGTLDCSADTLVSAIGLRAIGGDAISTLPVIPK